MAIGINQAAPLIGGIGQVFSPRESSSRPGAPESLSAVVDKMVSSLMSGGRMDLDSPLGKMVVEHMKGNGDQKLMKLMQNPQGAVKDTLMDLIKDKMGSNFVADASKGGQDLTSQVMAGLGKSALEGALKPNLDGSASFASVDKPLLQQVADYMDNNKAVFGPPNKAGSWSKELEEDNYLSKNEATKFKSAIDDISQQMNSLGSANGFPGNAGGEQSRTDYPGTMGGFGSSQSIPAEFGKQMEQLAQYANNSPSLGGFELGLQMGMGIGSGMQMGASGAHDTGTASHAAQNVFDIMKAIVT